MKWIPLALAALIVLATVYYITHPENPPTTPVDNGKSGVREKVLNSARGLMRARQYTEACNLMQSYVARFPDDVEVRPLLALAHMAKGENVQAEIIIDQALKISPRIAQVLWLKGELRRLRADGDYMNSFRLAVEQSADVTPEYWSRFGRELLAVNKAQEAGKWLEKAFENGCKDGPTLSALGETRLAAKRYAAAREALEDAMEKMPNDPHVALLLARACRNLNDLKTAGDILETAVKDHPDPDLYMELGEVCLLLKHPLGASAAFEAATHFSKFDRRAQAAFKAAEVFYSHHFDSDALEMIKIALELRPLDPEIQQLHQKILKASSRPGENRKP